MNRKLILGSISPSISFMNNKAWFPVKKRPKVLIILDAVWGIVFYQSLQIAALSFYQGSLYNLNLHFLFLRWVDRKKPISRINPSPANFAAPQSQKELPRFKVRVL